ASAVWQSRAVSPVPEAVRKGPATMIGKAGFAFGVTRGAASALAPNKARRRHERGSLCQT
ncbi:MAG: hypothetical protein WBD49_15915, partial [Bradyrhizobium sp.]